jgi:hypothetical protein
MDDRHDRRHRRQPDQREPSSVEERLELAEVEEEPDQAPQAAMERTSSRSGAVHPQRRLNRPLSGSLSLWCLASDRRYLSPGDHKKASAAPHSNPVARVSVPK